MLQVDRYVPLVVPMFGNYNFYQVIIVSIKFFWSAGYVICILFSFLHCLYLSQNNTIIDSGGAYMYADMDEGTVSQNTVAVLLHQHLVV